MGFASPTQRRWAFNALARDRPLCGICGRDCIDYDLPPSESLNPAYPTIDHIVPTVDGGSNDLSNLQMASRRCNSRKNRYNAARGVVKRVPGFVY